MTTHVFQQGAGCASTGATGGVGDGDATSLAGTTVTDEIRERDDNGGSNLMSIGHVVYGFANAPTNASGYGKFTLKFYRSGTQGLRLIVADDSSATGETTNLDIKSYRPNAAGSPTTNSFAGATGDETAEQYSRNVNTYSYGVKEQQVVDGEGFNDTTRGDIYWNSVKVYDAPFAFGTTWSPGDTVTGNDGYTYKVGSYQEVYNSDEYYAVIQVDPSETHYAFNASNAITGIRAVLTPTTSTHTTTGGHSQTTPLRNIAGSAITSNGTNVAIDTGWKTSSSDMTTGITLSLIHNTGTVSDASASNNFDAKLELYARTASEGDVRIKDFRVYMNTSSVSTY